MSNKKCKKLSFKYIICYDHFLSYILVVYPSPFLAIFFIILIFTYMFSQNSTPFALIEKDGIVTHYSGEIYKLDSLEELKRLSQSRVEEIIFMNPFRTIRERGYEAYGDEPILALVVSEKSSLQKEDMITLLADKKTPKLSDFSPSISDETYKIRVKEIQENEIAG